MMKDITKHGSYFFEIIEEQIFRVVIKKEFSQIRVNDRERVCMRRVFVLISVFTILHKKLKTCKMLCLHI